MKVSIQTTEPCRRQLHIEVPAEELRPDYEKILRVFLAEGTMPGFRKGKVPRALIERRYAKSIDGEFRHTVVARAYREAIREQGLSIVAVIGVENLAVAPAAGLSCDVTVDVAPEFTLPDYKGIAVKAAQSGVSDEALEEGIRATRERMADYRETTADYTAVAGDACEVAYEGTADGQPLGTLAPAAGELAAATSAWMVAGDERSIVPGMGTSLIGAAKGAVREIDTTFPDDHPTAALRGRTVHYRVTLASVRRRTVPILDAAFLQRLGIESEEALRAAIRRRLEREGEMREEVRRRDEIAGYLLRNTAIDVPRTLVAQETRSAVMRIVQDSVRVGMTREQLTEHQAVIVEAAGEQAQQRLRLSFILTRIADAEKIVASGAEIEARLAQMAQARSVPVEQVRAELQDRYGLDALANEIRCNKAMDWLLANAKDA